MLALTAEGDSDEAAGNPRAGASLCQSAHRPSRGVSAYPQELVIFASKRYVR